MSATIFWFDNVDTFLGIIWGHVGNMSVESPTCRPDKHMSVVWTLSSTENNPTYLKMAHVFSFVGCRMVMCSLCSYCSWCRLFEYACSCRVYLPLLLCALSSNLSLLDVVFLVVKVAFCVFLIWSASLLVLVIVADWFLFCVRHFSTYLLHFVFH